MLAGWCDYSFWTSWPLSLLHLCYLKITGASVAKQGFHFSHCSASFFLWWSFSSKDWPLFCVSIVECFNENYPLFTDKSQLRKVNSGQKNWTSCSSRPAPRQVITSNRWVNFGTSLPVSNGWSYRNAEWQHFIANGFPIEASWVPGNMTSERAVFTLMRLWLPLDIIAT